MHASHNYFYQQVFDLNFNGPLEPFLAGEDGLFSLGAYGLVVLVLWRTARLRQVHGASPL
jgi:hypothetical protein